MVYRVYVERRPGFAAEASQLLDELKNNLNIAGISGVRFLNRYDAEDIDGQTMEAASRTIFSEPQSDIITDKLEAGENDVVLAVEYLPGQFDQRADSCEQCIQLITMGDRPVIRTARIYVFSGDLSENDIMSIKRYLINPVECREADLALPETLKMKQQYPDDVKTVDGFTGMDDKDIAGFISKWGLAMDEDDVRFCRAYFRDVERRDPTVTELKVIDTYWSDHCRHTTFLTTIDDFGADDPLIKESFEDYLKLRDEVYGARISEKPVTLMDIATIGAKYLKSAGRLENLDKSEEINACSIVIHPVIDGKTEDWLLMFKNETHNHPTEIEPFGGAATCLGGCIRDPLSGRSYVYQAMRVTGAADPTRPISETMKGKLPQSVLTKGAANGYSSYGNQIGLATGGVYEIYHPGYAAKRMEIGAVVGAAPCRNVIREVPEPGDVVILLGGRTGRDGMGGATGSSKSHTVESLSSCGAEVQKGNAPEERKLQRLFRNPDAARMIRRCNDFGAGGVSVAIGELADGLEIDLDKVPKKYEGLDGTELAVSESQERMAVVVRKEDADIFISLAAKENLEATAVASVTDTNRMIMKWRGKKNVDLSREFLSSNGAPKHTSVRVEAVDYGKLASGGKYTGDIARDYKAVISDLNVCSQMGLSERFDSTIGAATVVMPFGGKNQLTAPQYMAAKLPTDGETDDASIMSYGFDPYLSSISPYHGAAWAVVDSAAKLVTSGVRYEDAYLTFQEYFGRTRGVPERWGKPAAALLGALRSQTELKIAAIGGKDSMSGSFENIDVPPTLVSFAVTTGKAGSLITPEFKKAGSKIYLFRGARGSDMMPDYPETIRLFDRIASYAGQGKALSIYTPGFGGVAEALFKMAIGNGIGVETAPSFSPDRLFVKEYGGFIVESDFELDGELIGTTTEEPSISVGGVSLPLDDLLETWRAPLEKVFPMTAASAGRNEYEASSFAKRPEKSHSSVKYARPRIVIPVFPGTNCEYDTAKAFRKAGGEPEIVVLRNLTSSALEASLGQLTEAINASQILMIPGGFSGGDEPDGSGKFITAVLRNPRVAEAVERLISDRDGLILGICNGFQALIKSGLLPYGHIMPVMDADSPTLTYNTIKRHQSMMVTTRIASVNSPWLAGLEVGDLFTIPISHGEGRFAASDEMLDRLAANGQIATQYTTLDGVPTSDIRYNPNNSARAIEGILSADGRIFGKMGHSERIDDNVARNVPGRKDQKLFESGVRYFA